MPYMSLSLLFYIDQNKSGAARCDHQNIRLYVMLADSRGHEPAIFTIEIDENSRENPINFFLLF